MAFFEDFGKKLSQAGHSAMQKGKELADITKLNISVSDEERKLDELYKKIGKLFVEKVGDRSEGDFLPLVTEVKEGQKKIEELKQQIKDIKGIAICPKCNAELPADAIFCNVCGEKLPEKQEQ